MSKSPYKGKSGFKRIFNAFQYSLDGLKSAFIHEAAFRQLIVLNLILVPLSFFLDVSDIERVLMILVCFLSLLVELINSAIEAIVDRISLEYNSLSKRAKDLGSAAQMVSLFMIIIVWVYILIA